MKRYLAAIAQERAPTWRSSAPIAPPSIDVELVDVVAGAIVEHGFDAEDLGFTRDAKLAFFLDAYAAKQAAIFREAAAESPEHEAARLRAHARVYTALLPARGEKVAERSEAG